MSEQGPDHSPGPTGGPPPDRGAPASQPPQARAIRCSLAPDRVVAALGAAARRGRLPGFRPGGHGGLFSVAAFGHPFDRVLVGRAEPGTATVIRFELRWAPLVPVLMAAGLIATVWPGVWLTDRMLKLWFDWYRVATWWWYLPVTVLPMPFAIRSLARRAISTTEQSAHAAIGAIASELGATELGETEIGGPDRSGGNGDASDPDPPVVSSPS